jgi:hypothetical protein
LEAALKYRGDCEQREQAKKPCEQVGPISFILSRFIGKHQTLVSLMK